MRERMFQIMSIIVQHAIKDRNLLRYERELNDLLAARGFNQDEIYEALSWMSHLQEEPDPSLADLHPARPGRSIRIPSPEERLAFSPAALGFLHRLHRRGIIDGGLREEIIQRALYLVEDEVGLEEVKTIALLVLYKAQREELGEDVSKLLENEGENLLN
ncbi:MAG: DUF494 family protein [Nitrospinota bacterium]